MTTAWQDMDDYSGTHRTSVADDWGAKVLDETGRTAGYIPTKVTPAYFDALKRSDVVDVEFVDIERTH